MATRTTTTLDRTRIAELTAKEQRRLDERTPGSREMYERARQALVGGVASADEHLHGGFGGELPPRRDDAEPSPHLSPICRRSSNLVCIHGGRLSTAI